MTTYTNPFSNPIYYIGDRTTSWSASLDALAIKDRIQEMQASSIQLGQPVTDKVLMTYKMEDSLQTVEVEIRVNASTDTVTIGGQDTFSAVSLIAGQVLPTAVASILTFGSALATGGGNVPFLGLTFATFEAAGSVVFSILADALEDNNFSTPTVSEFRLVDSNGGIVGGAWYPEGTAVPLSSLISTAIENMINEPGFPDVQEGMAVQYYYDDTLSDNFTIYNGDKIEDIAEFYGVSVEELFGSSATSIATWTDNDPTDNTLFNLYTNNSVNSWVFSRSTDKFDLDHDQDPVSTRVEFHYSDIRTFSGSLVGNGNDNLLIGSAGNDASMSGGNGNDLLLGGLGNDTLDGGLGSDTLLGGAGSDTAVFDLSVVADLTSHKPTVINSLDTDTLESIENIIGSDFDDNFTVSIRSGFQTIDGKGGNDTITFVNSSDFFKGASVYVHSDGTLETSDGAIFKNIESFSATGSAGYFMSDTAGQNYSITGTPILSYMHRNGSTGITANLDTGSVAGDTIAGGKNQMVIGGTNGNDHFTYTKDLGAVGIMAGAGNDVSTIGNETNTSFFQYMFQSGDDQINGALQQVGEIFLPTNVSASEISLEFTEVSVIEEFFYQVNNGVVNSGGSSTPGQNGYLDHGTYKYDIKINIGNHGSVTLKEQRIQIIYDATPQEGIAKFESNTLNTLKLYSQSNGQLNTYTFDYSNDTHDPNTITVSNTTTQHDPTYMGSAGADDIDLSNYAGGDFDDLYFFAGNDKVKGTNLGESIYLDIGDDEALGLGGNDILNGGFGNDILDGGAGDDFVVGGAGNDTLTYKLQENSGATDYYYGNSGTDILNLHFTSAQYSQYESQLIEYNNIFIKNASASFAGGDVYTFEFGLTASGIEDLNIYADGVQKIIPDSTTEGDENDNTVSTSAQTTSQAILTYGGNDIVVSGSGADIIFAGDGNDDVNSGAGNDTLVGGIGNDTLNGGADIDTADYSAAANAVHVNLNNGAASNDGDGGSDTLVSIENAIGSTGNDTLTGDTGDNVLRGEDGDDFIYGYDGNDTLYGGAGNDELRGQNGTDTYYAGDGNDLIYSDQGDTAYGEAGDDVFRAYGGTGLFDGGDGTDRVWWRDYMHAGNVGLTVDLAAGTATDGDGNIATLVSIENITGSSYNDILHGDNNINIIRGGGNYNGLTDGDDTIYGYGGNDKLYGDAGVDTIYGGDGDDTISGNDGNDILHGGDGVDYITGDAGDDIIYAGGGNDEIYAGAGLDTVYGGEGNDILRGEEDADILFGDEGSDYLYGYGDNDALSGGAGIDYMYGGDGDDTLTFDQDSDRMYGNAGADTFIAEEGSNLDHAMSYIYDFAESEDHVDVSDLLGGYNSATDTLSDFVNIAQGYNTTIQIDRDGTGTAHGWDNVVRLQGNTTIGTNVDQLVLDGTLIV